MSPSLPHVLFIPQFAEDPATLFAELLRSTEWDRRMHSRLTASFGVPYNYSGLTYPEVPLPPVLELLTQQLRQEVGFLPNNCLANYYPDGNSTLGFHADQLEGLVPGTGVAIVSLGAARTLRFRLSADQAVVRDYQLPAGSLLYMPPEVQLHWKHGVPAEPGTGPRISLTFRRLTCGDMAR